jgi:hypothetical protein
VTPPGPSAHPELSRRQQFAKKLKKTLGWAKKTLKVFLDYADTIYEARW